MKSVQRPSPARFGLIALTAALLLVCPRSPAAAEDWRFTVKFSQSVRKEPFSGRVYLFFSRNRPEPRPDPSWFSPEQFIARDVHDWKPGAVLEFASGEKSI